VGRHPQARAAAIDTRLLTCALRVRRAVAWRRLPPIPTETGTVRRGFTVAKTITDLARNEMYVVGDLLDLYSVPAAFTGGGKTHPCDR